MKKIIFLLFCITPACVFAQSVGGDQRSTTPYISVNAGYTIPWEGFGSHYYYVYLSDLSSYAGFAGNGGVASVQAGLKTFKGWGLTGMFSYYVNGFDANGFINESAVWFINGITVYTPPGDYSQFNVLSAYSNEKHYYKNHAILAGITKNWEHNKITGGISIMGGSYFINRPATTGHFTMNITKYSNGYAAGDTTGNYTFIVGENHTQAFLFTIYAHLDINLHHNFFIRFLSGMVFSTLYYDLGQFSIIDSKGNSVWGGNFPKNARDKGDGIRAGIADFTVGIGYQFRK